jgi:hypothetical protein
VSYSRLFLFCLRIVQCCACNAYVSMSGVGRVAFRLFNFLVCRNGRQGIMYDCMIVVPFKFNYLFASAIVRRLSLTSSLGSFAWGPQVTATGCPSLFGMFRKLTPRLFRQVCFKPKRPWCNVGLTNFGTQAASSLLRQPCHSSAHSETF